MINNVVLIGRLAKDVALHRTPNGISAGAFTLAVDRPKYKNDSEDKADFIRCIAWRKAAEILAQYTKKGSLIGVQGRLQTEQYEKNGTKIYVTQVLVSDFCFLDHKPANNQTQTSKPDNKANNDFFNNPKEKSEVSSSNTTDKKESIANDDDDLNDDTINSLFDDNGDINLPF